MKRAILPIVFYFCVFLQNAQQTFFLTDPQATYKQAQEFYQKQYYSLAYPIIQGTGAGSGCQTADI